MIRPGFANGRARRRGFTLTEVLIAIMIMGVGLVSVAVLFPIGLLRLREAQRQSRSALLYESAAADMAARSLVNAQSFTFADLVNGPAGYGYWYACGATDHTPNGLYNPLIQDLNQHGGNVYTGNALTDLVGLDASNPYFHVTGSAGLPFCYDPLWRYKTKLYSGDSANDRFGSGIGLVRNDPDGAAPSAHGLQRLTNFNGRVMPTSAAVPRIFVSPEDVVWNEANNPFNLSPILPDRTIEGMSATYNDGAIVNDWRFSWFFTGRLNSASNAAVFEGDMVICENRPFDLDPGTGKPADEIVVEGVFGHSKQVVAVGTVGFGGAADRTVLLRWNASQPDPIVKVGTWICDVTYERTQATATSRFAGVPNPLNGGKWDNMPAQRAYWYQVVRVSDAVADPDVAGQRSMVVRVNSALRARTPLKKADGTPAVVNACLIAPYVVNVVPRTIVIR